jgi:hypothetical protein
MTPYAAHRPPLGPRRAGAEGCDCGTKYTDGQWDAVEEAARRPGAQKHSQLCEGCKAQALEDDRLQALREAQAPVELLRKLAAHEGDGAYAARHLAGNLARRLLAES